MDKMTYQEAAKRALDCQDACNLSGVVTTFYCAMMALWDEALRTGQGTEWVNHHPIAILFMDKCASLGGYGLHGEHDVLDAFATVKKIAEGL